jgi:hypothetical protein
MSGKTKPPFSIDSFTILLPSEDPISDLFIDFSNKIKIFGGLAIADNETGISVKIDISRSEI